MSQYAIRSALAYTEGESWALAAFQHPYILRNVKSGVAYVALNYDSSDGGAMRRTAAILEANAEFFNVKGNEAYGTKDVGFNTEYVFSCTLFEMHTALV